MPLYWRNVEPRLLLPSFVQDLHDVVGQDGGEWYVTTGFRSIEESDRLFAIYQQGGPKAAPGGKSPHNFGLAVDLALDGDRTKPGVQMDWVEDHPAWIRLRQIIDASPRMHGGWHFGDGDHIERTNWKDFKGWAQK